MFVRTRIIRGQAYRYEEHRWRDGGKVRSKSIYRGKVFDVRVGGGDVSVGVRVVAPKPEPIEKPKKEKGLRFIEEQTKQYPRQSKDDPPNVVEKAPEPKEDGGDDEGGSSPPSET